MAIMIQSSRRPWLDSELVQVGGYLARVAPLPSGCSPILNIAGLQANAGQGLKIARADGPNRRQSRPDLQATRAPRPGGPSDKSKQQQPPADSEWPTARVRAGHRDWHLTFMTPADSS